MLAMPQPHRCRNGHEWDAASDATLAGCPRCGAEIEADDYPDEMPPPPPRPLPASTLFTVEMSSPPAGELPQLPGYEVLRELGRGGMGVVYLARDRKLLRLVALKMILGGPQSGFEERARFRVEAETVARLQHPHIVQIFEVGEWNGQPYFALEYLDGGSLAKQLGRPLPMATAVQLGQTLALAVQYAHDCGVIHRDLKPANVLMSTGGDAQSALGRRMSAKDSEVGPPAIPKITDFGLAKRLDAESGATQTGSILGTPNYMSPEQAAGRAREIGPATDTYALGAILYELLTGRPPFLGSTPMETVLHVIHDEPASPRLLNPGMPRDLETICLKCLRKEPAKRYASAGAMAEDLRRFAEGRPILARPVGALERGWRLTLRNPIAALLAGAFLASLLVGIVVATYFAVQSARRAEKNLEMKKIAERRLYLARMNLGSRAWEEGQVVRVLELLDKTRPEGTGGIDLRGFEWHYLWRCCHEHDLRVIQAHAAPIAQVAWSSRGIVASAAKDRLVKLWDPATGETIAELHGHEFPVASLAFAADGRLLASGDEFGNVRIWDVGQRACIQTLKCANASIRCLGFSKDGSRLLASPGNMVWQWRTDNWQGGRPDTPGSGVIYGLAWARNDSRFVTADSRGQVMFHDVQSRAASSVGASDGYLSALAVSADGEFVASGGLDGQIKIWEAADVHRMERSYSGLAGDMAALAFSANDRFLISAGITGAVTIRDRQTDDVRIIAHTGPVETFAISPDQSTIAMAGSDGLIKLASIDLHPRPPPVHLDRVYVVAVDAAGKIAASGDREGAVRLWDVASGKSTGELVRRGPVVRSVAFSPDGSRVVVGDNSGKVRVFDSVFGKELAAWAAHGTAVWGIAFFPDGGRFATAGYDDATVCIWDFAARTRLRSFKTRSDRAWCVAVSPDGRLVAAGGSKGELNVWDADSGDLLLKLTKGDGFVWSLAFSPDGTTLVAGLENGTIARWNVATGAALADLPGHHAIVRTLGFVPDGQTLYTGAEDGLIKLWDLPSGEERARLLAHAGAVWSVTVTPDGKTLISGGVDRRVRFWRADSPVPSH